MIALAVLALLAAEPSQAMTPRLVLTGAGRFAVFADLSTLQRDGDRTRLRALQVAEEDFEVAGQRYWGGWSRWAFDCEARTADRLDFASVKEGGEEGPATPDPAPPYDAAPGGDAAELLAVACGTAPDTPAIESIAEAVQIGRAALAE